MRFSVFNYFGVAKSNKFDRKKLWAGLGIPLWATVFGVVRLHLRSSSQPQVHLHSDMSFSEVCFQAVVSFGVDGNPMTRERRHAMAAAEGDFLIIR